MSQAIDKITIEGFKSIESLKDFRLNKLNILIGANGAGKSNFVDYFRMLRAFADESFQQYVLASGGGDSLLHLGPKKTSVIQSEIEFGSNSYQFALKPTANGSLLISKEEAKFNAGKGGWEYLSSGSLESALKANKNAKSSWRDTFGVPHYVYKAVSNWTVYHFHDTSPLAAMRRDQPLRDFETFRHDASNIAAYLYNLQENEEDSYELIKDSIKLIAPFFDNFLLRPQKKGTNEQVRLEWQQKGSDFPFQPSQLSDGTIRFICLTTALLQPYPPATIVIDEPELGLHPLAIALLAELIKSTSERTQVIVSTQSPILLDYFEPEDIVTVNRYEGHSTFARLNADELESWLEDYSVGELWQKNIVRGGPSYE